MLRVLTYHRVAEPGNTPWLHPRLISATPRDFEQQMRHLAQEYDVVTMSDVLDARRSERSLGERAVLITFDDAYVDFGDSAWPVLRALGLPAVLFVPTAYPDRPDRAFWWDRLYRAFLGSAQAEVRSSLGLFSLRSRDHRFKSLGRAMQEVKRRPHHEAMSAVDELCARLEEPPEVRPSVLGWDRLRALCHEGLCIGAHTRTHPLLTRVSEADARAEIVGSQQDLQAHLGQALPVFCYPDGDRNDRLMAMLGEERFELAFTTLDRQNDLGQPHADPLPVFRMNVTPRTSPMVFRLRLTELGSRLDRWRRDLRERMAS